MTATIGPDDIDLYASPRPALLRLIAGVEPEPRGTHVLLEGLGIRSVQRLLVSDAGGSVIVAFWPAELKPQAEYLFVDGRGERMVGTAVERGWNVWAVPQLAFFNSPASRRLYMTPDIDPIEYARRWEGRDAQWIGQHAREALRPVVWPWLKKRGYVSDGDDDALEQFLPILGNRPAHLRPALRFHRRWDRSEIEGLAEDQIAVLIREDVNAVLRAAEEPTLPAR